MTKAKKKENPKADDEQEEGLPLHEVFGAFQARFEAETETEWPALIAGMKAKNRKRGRG